MTSDFIPLKPENLFVPENSRYLEFHVCAHVTTIRALVQITRDYSLLSGKFSKKAYCFFKEQRTALNIFCDAFLQLS
jgi:hypothetical protein